MKGATGPKANAQTPVAFWKGMRLLAIDGTVESVADTQSNREAFRYSTDDECSHSPFPQARLLASPCWVFRSVQGLLP